MDSSVTGRLPAATSGWLLPVSCQAGSVQLDLAGASSFVGPTLVFLMLRALVPHLAGGGEQDSMPNSCQNDAKTFRNYSKVMP